MNFEINEKNEFFLAKVKSFLIENNVEESFNSDLERFPLHLREIAGKENLIGLDISKDDGGLGLDLVTMGLLYKECGTASVNARELIGAGHGRILSEFGDVQLKKSIIPSLLKGRSLIGIGLTEPDCGSDLSSIKTFATKHKDGYLINGEKEWVSRIDEANYFIVFCQTKEDSGVHGITPFLIPMDDSNIEKYYKEPMGLKGWSYGGFKMENVFIPAEYRISEEGNGFKIFNSHFEYWRVLMALICIGSAEKATNLAINYAKTRKSFGGPIGRFQAVMHKISDNLTKLESAKLLCIKSLFLLDKGLNCTKEVAMAKWYGTYSAYEAIDNVMQIFGARGYVKEFGIEQRLRDVRGLMIADGSNDVMKSIIGREVFGKNIYKQMYGWREQIPYDNKVIYGSSVI
ncbi:acyl-CoA dehydrogenase family protein [Bacillus sp. MHSD_36]|uniref:acyl-CoA dehydrogenase family protein n=1 Tax=unclassified Bacillus (in: firmicutes) TaxID=185979 RepID=UPI00274149E7|nr:MULTISPECIES: acyl-CoA dehydrogenase family protein [unclassified Bacillus (in: firmicutes)]MDP7992175.1 acyl-CoA dehydrogenase family protein [Bacillus sp. MHSD_36]MDR4980969.1 acyl-CoA dehydrogenase family protein [Bacillus sp. MHSD_37]